MLSKINFVLIFVVILHIEFYACDIVATEYGRVQGRLRETEKGTKYFSFQAIPYAKAPDGNLRFRVKIMRLKIRYEEISWDFFPGP